MPLSKSYFEPSNFLPSSQGSPRALVRPRAHRGPCAHVAIAPERGADDALVCSTARARRGRTNVRRRASRDHVVRVLLAPERTPSSSAKHRDGWRQSPASIATAGERAPLSEAAEQRSTRNFTFVFAFFTNPKNSRTGFLRVQICFKFHIGIIPIIFLRY